MVGGGAEVGAGEFRGGCGIHSAPTLLTAECGLQADKYVQYRGTVGIFSHQTRNFVILHTCTLKQTYITSQ